MSCYVLTVLSVGSELVSWRLGVVSEVVPVGRKLVLKMVVKKSERSCQLLYSIIFLYFFFKQFIHSSYRDRDIYVFIYLI